MANENHPLSVTSLVNRSNDLISTEVDGEAVLMSVEKGRYYGLDDVGTEIWRRLEQPTRIERLVTAMKEHFEGDPETIETEVLAFLTNMAEQELLEVHP
jgi:hypothetical protein